MVVLLGLYSLLTSEVGTAAGSGSDGFVTASKDGRSDSERAHGSRHHRNHRQHRDGDEKRDRADSGSQAARAAARADARAEDLDSAAEAKKAREATRVTRKTRTQPPAADAGTDTAGGTGTSGSDAAVADGANTSDTASGTSSDTASGTSSDTTSGTGGAVTATAVPATGRPGALSWAPPQGYAGYPVRQVTSAGSYTSVDGHGSDVRIELPRDHPVGPISIKNCRNAVLIGGQINVLPTDKVDGQDQRAIYVSKCTGTVHIEGVLINGNVAGSQSDAIAVNAPDAVLQIQNVRVEGMRGGKSGNHADVFQPWGGVREFRIDGLTGSTNYQGLHIQVDLGDIGRGTIRNTNISSSEVTPIDKGGQFLWMDCNAYPITMDNVYIAGRSGRAFGTSIWPQSDDGSCPAQISGGLATWPKYSSLSGGVHEGRPSSGDFVPAGSVGVGYLTPGPR